MKINAIFNFGLAALALAAGFSGTADAALLSRAGGTMVYDSSLDVTWVADANLFKTQAAGNPNLVSQILAAVPSVSDSPNIYDTPANSGTHTLTPAEFNTSNGRMNWFAAQAWASYLVYGGVGDWRLPTTDTSCGGLGCTGSELGHLWYGDINSGLGGVAEEFLTGAPQGFQDVHNANFSLFSNIAAYDYWTSAENSTLKFTAWLFTMDAGSQGTAAKTSQAPVFLVRNGDVAAVPVPEAVWLFGSALAGLGVFGRRRTSG